MQAAILDMLVTLGIQAMLEVLHMVLVLALWTVNCLVAI
jgi:hypothetical protein